MVVDMRKLENCIDSAMKSLILRAVIVVTDPHTPLAINSRINQFLGFIVRKMTSTTVSFERRASLRVQDVPMSRCFCLEKLSDHWCATV